MHSGRRHLLRKPQLVWMELDAHRRHYHVGYGSDSETIVPLSLCHKLRYQTDLIRGCPEDWWFSKACSRALGAVCLLGATSAELLRVKRYKFPDAHRRPAGHPLDAVRLPVITTCSVQRAHRQQVPHQMLR